MLTIQFLISTLGERIAQAAKVLLPPVEGVMSSFGNATASALTPCPLS